MIAELSDLQIGLIAALIVVYIIASVRVALHAGRTGRSPVRWFFISIFFTAIPAMIMFNYEYFKPRLSSGQAKKKTASRPVDHCQHCGHVIQAGQIKNTDGVALCPNCDLPLQEGPIA